MAKNVTRPSMGDLSKSQRVCFGTQSLRNAKQCLQQRAYARAFTHLLVALKYMPEKKIESRQSFMLAFRELCTVLEREARLKDLFQCYKEAADLFPDSDTMLDFMGSQLFRLGYVYEAANCFRKVLRLNPSYVSAQESLDNVCGHLVERWHYRMLNDTLRNQQYCNAIQRAIAHGGHRSVLDIGTGTAILSLFAASAGAQTVYGCEMSKTMYEIACAVVRGNNMDDSVRLLHKKSTDMYIPEHINERVSLVVTETFDAGLLGEHVLTSLEHAWAEMLNPLHPEDEKSNKVDPSLPKPTVIPSSATVYICAIQCGHIRKQTRMLYSGLRHLDMSSCDIVSAVSMGSVDHSNRRSCASLYCCKPDSTQEGDSGLTTPSSSNSASLEKCKVVLINGFKQRQSSADSAGVTQDSSSEASSSSCLSSSDEDKKDLLTSSSCDSDSTQSEGCGDEMEHVDPYSTDILEKARGGYKLLTEVTKLTTLQFDDPEEVLSAIRGHHGAFSLPVKHVGQLDAIVMWFDLYLDDVNILSSAPQAHSCWDQAVFPVLTSHLNYKGNNNLSVKPGQSLNLDWGYHSNAFYFVCTDIKSGAKPTHLPRQCTRVVESDPHDTTCGLSPHESAFPSAITHPHQPNNSISTVPCDIGSCKITASDSGDKNSVLNTLNTQHVGAQSGDTTHCTGSQTRVPNIHSLQTSMCDTIDGTADSRVDGPLSDGGSMLGLPDYDRPMFRLDCQDIWHLNDIDSNSAFCKAIEHCISKQVDTSGGWSMLTITKGFSVLGLQALVLGAKEVGVVEQNHGFDSLLMHLAAVNNVDIKRLTPVSKDIDDTDSRWDILVTNLVNQFGCFQQRILEDIALARATCLKPGGVVIPHAVTVYGLLVDSCELLSTSALIDDDRTLGFHVAKYINEYQTRTHVDIDLSKLVYHRLSEPFEMLKLSFNDSPSGEMPEFLHSKQDLTVTVCDDGTLTAIVYWFVMHLTPDIKLDTLDSNLHWKQAAIVQPECRHIRSGTQLSLQAVCHNSCIHVVNKSHQQAS